MCPQINIGTQGEDMHNMFKPLGRRGYCIKACIFPNCPRLQRQNFLTAQILLQFVISRE